MGFKFPEPFTVKADDGVTDLYGVMYKPFDFDEKKKYPIIAYVYPGPQTESVTKVFNPRSSNVALAQFGFIVIEPEQADCLLQSARLGRATHGSGSVDSVMAGLACGEASPLAWRVLETSFASRGTR